MEKLPNRIRKLRKAARLSLMELAEKAGTNHVTLSHVERGGRQLTHDMMVRIAASLGCTPADLLTDNDNPLRLDEDEQEVINALRSMDAGLRQKLQETVTRFAPQPEPLPLGENGE